MSRSRRTGAPLGAGLVGLLVAGAYQAAWYVWVERPVCESSAVLGCIGPGVLMLGVGVPLTYLALALGLRAVRAPLPWLAPLAVAGALVVLGRVAWVVDPPLWLWSGVVAVLCAAWPALVRRARTGA